MSVVKASLTLPNGTLVEIDGSVEDVEQLLLAYGGTAPFGTLQDTGKPSSFSGRKETPKPFRTAAEPGEPEVNLTAIVNVIKDCEEAERIEQKILDKTSQVDRTLLPLYVVHEYLDNEYGLTSGDIAKVTTQLSVPVAQPAASRTLSGTASKYVIGDGQRKKGKAIRYKLSRRGLKYMKSVVTGDTGE